MSNTIDTADTTDTTDSTQTSVEANSTRGVLSKSPVERLKESSKSPLDPRSFDDKCGFPPFPPTLLRQKRYFPWFSNLDKISGLPKNLEHLNYRRLAEYINSYPEHSKTSFSDLCTILGITVTPLEPDEKRMSYSGMFQECTLTPVRGTDTDTDEDTDADTSFFPDVFSRPPSRTLEYE